MRDKEGREVDFLVTERRRPWLLLETKLSDEQPSSDLRYFSERVAPRHTMQVVRHGSVRHHGGLLVIPAARALGLI